MKRCSRWFAGLASILRWETQTLLRRPVTYFILLTAVVVSAWSFAWLVTLIARGGGVALRQADDPIAQYVGPNLFLVGFVSLLAPLLTMNLVAEERRRGTWESLITTPVSIVQILCGKFLAHGAFFVVALLPWLFQLAVLRFWNGETRLLWGAIPLPAGGGVPFDAAIALCGGIGLTLVAGTVTAIGLVCSSAARRPITAALATFAVLLAIFLVSILPRVLELWGFSREQTAWIDSASMWHHLEQFSRGTLRPRVIVGSMTLWTGLLALAARLTRRVDER